MLQALTGPLHTFASEDTADLNETDPGIDQLPVEYLQSLNPPGLPSSQLQLKVGAPVILLRNLDPQQGLYNGTRLVVTRLGIRCIEAVILDGHFAGTSKLLPWIKLSTLLGDLPFILTRKQFPIRLCFAMTINKAQDQSLDVIGIDLRVPVFTHGQLYVALSRATDVRKMAALLPLAIQTTVKIVYPEILLKVNIYILQLEHNTNCYTIGIEHKQIQLQPATIMSGEGDTE